MFLGTAFQDFINGYGIWVIIGVLGLAFVVAFIFLILNIEKAKKLRLENEKTKEEKSKIEELPIVKQEIKSEEFKKSSKVVQDNPSIYSINYDKTSKEWVVKKNGATRASKRCQTEKEALNYIEKLKK